MKSFELRCLFHGQYHAKYQRNNKRCGFKNLRCFPYCGPHGTHHEQGFCGAPVSVDLTFLHGEDSGVNLAKVQSWGEFVLKDASPRFPIGTLFSSKDIAPLLRNDSERSNPLFESSVEEETSMERKQAIEHRMTCSFHSHRMGYHYGWVGNKHSVSFTFLLSLTTALTRSKTNQEHCFCVYVALQVAPDQYQCIGVFQSASFTIFCRRRHQTVSKEEKDQMAECPQVYKVVHRLDPNGRIQHDGGSVITPSEGEGKRSPKQYELRKRTRLCSEEDSPRDVASIKKKPLICDDDLLLLSLGTSAEGLDFQWMLNDEVAADDASSQDKARARFVNDMQFKTQLQISLRMRSLATFRDAVRNRTTELSCDSLMPSTTTPPSGTTNIRRAFERLCVTYSKSMSSPSILPCSASASPCSSLEETCGLSVEELEFLSDETSSSELSIQELADMLFSVNSPFI